MWITIIILILAAIFFVNGKIRSDIVALCALVALLVFQILTPEEALSGFSNSVVIMMVGLFIVGGAIFQTGLAKMIGSKLMKLAGNSETRLFLLVMLATASIGAFVSNTGTVALMLPIVVSMAMNSNSNQGRLLMPLAFASSMGGMMTLIGTPPNMIIEQTLSGSMEEIQKTLPNYHGLTDLEFFTFLPVGIICVIVGTVVLLPLSKIFLSGKEDKNERNVKKHKSLSQLMKEYGVSNNMYRVKVNADSTVQGKTIVDLDIRKKYNLNVLEVRRGDKVQNGFFKNVEQMFVYGETMLENDDLLFLTGDEENVNQFVSDFKLERLDDGEKNNNSTNKMAFYDLGVAEIVLMPNSRLLNHSMKELDFREKYHVSVLGIQRQKNYIKDNIVNEKLRSADVLLMQGTWQNIGKLSQESENFVVLGQPLKEASKVTFDYKAPVAAAIMILMIAMMVFDFIPVAPVTAVLIASLLMILTGCFRNVEAAYKTINWESIVLIGAMMPMSLALEKTGASEWISGSLVSSIGSYGPYALMAGIYFTTSLMTMFISNTATAVLMAPIALQSALSLGVSPVPYLFAVTLGASMCFASPFSTPPNALVMSAGQYTFMDYVKVGLPLQIIMGIVMIFVLPLLFQFN
ncbi:MAG: SLC13 family permease [Phocaeicola sp.]|uniref:SLC13 family permease n=1 Tax=Phocaeicola TaxID=909656 RepID=UPI00234FABCB|nr:SLC13 family permease [Phocaeicola oris]MCE2616510.1 SLC13 family permease [Phocaeicola oris]